MVVWNVLQMSSDTTFQLLFSILSQYSLTNDLTWFELQILKYNYFSLFTFILQNSSCGNGCPLLPYCCHVDKRPLVECWASMLAVGVNVLRLVVTWGNDDLCSGQRSCPLVHPSFLRSQFLYLIQLRHNDGQTGYEPRTVLPFLWWRRAGHTRTSTEEHCRAILQDPNNARLAFTHQSATSRVIMKHKLI